MNVAFWGTGLMGRPMVSRLLEAGHHVTVFNRTREKALALQDKGAVIADDPAGTLSGSDVVIMMITHYPAIQAVLSQVPASDWNAKTVIQMGTILPEESIGLKKTLKLVGGGYFECPVLGSRDKVEQGDLILMIGSTRQQYEKYDEFLGCFGSERYYIGDVGKAAALKLALNHLIIALLSSFSVSLGMVRHAGVSVDDFMGILRKSALYAPTFDKKLDRILRRDFTNPNFPVRHMYKDMSLILEQASGQGLDETLLQALKSVLQKAIESGLAEGDYSAVSQVIDPFHV